MRKRREPAEELDDLIIEGESFQPVMVDYNVINMYMNRTPIGTLGCAANILLLLLAGSICLGAYYLYIVATSLTR